MAKNTINLISSVSNDYSTLIKVKLNGEEVVLVGKQNFAFNKPYSFDSFREKHANFLKTLHSFPKSYFTERNDDAKKDVLIPSIKSYNVAQVGNKFITLNNLSNNPIMYNGNIGRIFGAYYYDTNDFIYGTLNYDVLEKYVNYGIDDETFKNNILKYLKDNLYNNPTPTKANGEVITSYDELQDYEYGAALERPRKGYPIIENVKGLTIYGDLDYIDPNSTEAPTNSFYELDDNWIWNTADNKSPKPVFTNFSRLQNNLSPLSQPELTFETSTPQFRMWRKYHNMGINDSNNLWLSYNLELARSSRIELNPWRTGPESNPVSTIDDEPETTPTLQLEDEYTPETTLAYGESSRNFVSTIGKQFEQSLFTGYSFFISFDGSTQAIGKPMIMIRDGSTGEPLFSVLDNPLQQLFLYGEESENDTNISSSVISSWSKNYISGYLDEANEYAETSINTIIPKNDSTQSLMYNITMDNNINSGDYINNNNQVIIKTNSTLSLDNIKDNGVTFKFTTSEKTSGQSLKFSNITDGFKETFKTKSYSNTIDKSFNSSINLNSDNSDRKFAFKGTVNIDSFSLKPNAKITLTLDSNDTLEDDNVSNPKIITISLSTNDSVNFSIKLSDDDDKQIINNSNTGSPTEFAMFGNTITVIGINSIYTNYEDTTNPDQPISQPISIIYDETRKQFSCIYNNKTYTTIDTITDTGSVSGAESVLNCFENIEITINVSGFIEDFYLHPLTSNVIPGILVDNNTTLIELGKSIDINSSDTHTIDIPSITNNDVSFTDIFGSQFALTLFNTTFKTVDDVDVSDETSFIIGNNIYATIDTDKKTLYCTIVGEGFDKLPLDNIIDITTPFTPKNNVLYTPASSNTLNYIADKSELVNADNIKTDSDIYNVLKHNLFKRFLTLASTVEVDTSKSVDALTINSYAKCYVTFVLYQINSKPIELYKLPSTDDSKPIHTFTTKELVTQLELAPGTYEFKYSDESSIGADNSLNKNFEKIYIEYYSYPDNFDDETFEHIIKDYTEFKHKQIELNSTSTAIFNSSLTSQCVILQDISNIEADVSITIKNNEQNKYELFLDEALIIGSTDMSQVCAASNYEGTLLDVYYTVFNSKNIEQYTSLQFSKELNIVDSGSISKNTIIQSKNSSTGNILNLYFKYSENPYSIKSDETVIYEKLQTVSPSKKHIISGIDYGLYLELSSVPTRPCELKIDGNKICDIDKEITNIRFSTLGYNITSEQITLSNYSGIVDKFIVYPLYTNYFPSISGFSNKLLTDTSKSSVYSAKIHIVPNSKFSNTYVIRNLFSYDSLMTVSDNTNTTELDRQTISYSNELQYYVHEPKLTDNDKDDWNNLRDNLNNNVITNYDLNIKSIFGGFSIYDDKVVVTDPLLRSYNYANLSSIGFVIEFNEDEEFEGNEINIKTFINGNIVDSTFNSKSDGSGTSMLWKKLYDNLNYGNLTITYGDTPSKIHAVRSWNYALDDSAFNMLHNQFSLYQDVSTINNEIYEYKFYDTENRLGDWVLTDESVFNKTPIILEIKDLVVSLKYITTEDEITFYVVVNNLIQNTVYNYTWYKNSTEFPVEDNTINTNTIEKSSVSETGDEWYVEVSYGDTTYTTNTIELSNTFDASLYVNDYEILLDNSEVNIVRYTNPTLKIDNATHPNKDDNDPLRYTWKFQEIYDDASDDNLSNDSSITIDNLTYSTIYTCVITNTYGYSIEKSVKLICILESVNITHIINGNTITFTCNVNPSNGINDSIKYAWYKNSVKVQDSSLNTYSILKNEAEDCTFYAECYFRPNYYTSNVFKIDNEQEKVLSSPIIEQDLSERQTLIEGNNLVLSITLKTPEEYTTYGTINYEIYKNDDVIKTGELSEDELSESNYSITYTKNNLSTNDSGEYKISLQNSADITTSNTCTVTVARDLSRYYVVPNGAGNKDGSSWSNAYADVQAAIDKASSIATLSNPVEVWIAKGTYKHGSEMTMKNGVAIYGGFAGTETSKEERTSGNDTILDGEGKYRVFYNNYTEENPLTNSAKLDNVTIQNAFGSGMYNIYASPEITNCTFANNSAPYGGGMRNSSLSPVLINCTFSGNSASDSGGGMFNTSGSSPVLINCTFSGNSAKSYGGGMDNSSSSSPTLTNCTFTNNSAYRGGGMFNNYPSSPVLTNCILWGNTASLSGNEIYNNSGCNPIIDTCIIQGGVNGIYGNEHGAYTNIITADPKLEDLKYNGGFVPTCEVKAGSSAIGAGIVVEGVTTDARGVARSKTAPTIGAYEYTEQVSGTYYVSTNGTYVLSSYSLARNANQNITENVEYKLITDINDINYDTDVIAVRFSPWQTQYNKFDVKYDYEDSEKGSDNHRLFLIKDFDYIDRFAGLYRLDNGEGRASNLYSIKISNSGFATNNYVPGTDDYELQELMNTTCKAALDNAIVSLTKKIQPINTQLFKVIYDDPGFIS